MMEVCRDPLWNNSLSWETEDPRITDCLQSLLEICSCGVLLVCLPASAAWLMLTRPRSQLRPLPRGGSTGPAMLSIRLATILLICIATLLTVGSQRSLVVADIASTTAVLLGCLGAAILEIVHVQCLSHTSYLTTIFWHLLLLVTLPQFKVSVQDWVEGGDSWIIMTGTLRWPLVLLSAVLQWIPNISVLPNGVPAESSCSAVSSILFGWFSGLVWKGWKQPLFQEHLPDICPSLDVTSNVDKFLIEETSSRKRTGSVSLWSLLIKCYYSHYLLGILFFLLRSVILFLAPIILTQLIRFVDSGEEPLWCGFVYGILLFLSSVFSVIIDHHGLHQVVLAAIQMRNATVSAVYRKSLRLSSTARQTFTTGEITNFMSVDAQRLIETIPFSPLMIVSPIQIVLCWIFLYQILGVSIFAGIGVLVIMTPFNMWAGSKGEKMQQNQLGAKDKRIKLMSEILSGIKVLKLYAWEKPFMESVKLIRQEELNVLKWIGKLWAFLNFIFTSVPFLMILATFITFIHSSPNNYLNAENVFVSLTVFNIMRLPLVLFPLCLMDTIKLFVSVARVNKFLNAEELEGHGHTTSEKSSQNQYPINPANSIEVDKASFTWENKEAPTLSNINIDIKVGELVAVVGLVGAGKSSFLSALLQEMTTVSGTCRFSGTRAYVAQQAWIQNMTVKNNILFGHLFDQDKYQETLSACGLLPDLDLLPAEDLTEIGENGINLSGGQKQRVALARAVYQRADVYLLDDPLAALDAHVGHEVFTKVIGPDGILRNATRILVTHNVAVLKHVHNILVIVDGKIGEYGTYNDLINKKGPFSLFLDEYAKEITVEKEVLSNKSTVGESPSEKLHNPPNMLQDLLKSVSEDNIEDQMSEIWSNAKDVDQQSTVVTFENNDRLTEDEKALTGKIKWRIYIKYIKAIGVSVFTFNFLMYFITEALHSASNIMLQRWTDDPNSNVSSTQNSYMAMYAGFGLGQALSCFLKEIILFLACVKASKSIHENLLSQVMHSPMSFFDTNPTGRILNRFSSDIDTVDQTIPPELDDFMNCLVEVIGILTIISYTTPLFMTLLIPLAIMYFALQKFYIETSRQLKRLDMISKSPIFSHFTETVTGAASIRAFGATPRFIEKSEHLVGVNNQCLYLSFVSNRWLGVRLENLGNVVVLASALFAVLYRTTLTGGLAGLSISYSLSLTETLNWLVRMVCQLETNSVSLERIFEYETREEESPWETAVDDSIPYDWPAQGHIEMEGLTVSYRPGLPPVLKEMSVDIKPNEKIGVCGRTGAGKSSLSLSLFRIMEASKGSITIDGEDISRIGLELLRSRLTIIPQDPVLFSSSLRFNLDPATKYTDQDINRCLSLAGLAQFNGQLDQQVQEKGENFSVGQRQLMCLARALLRSTRILLLDEATAAVDLETDDVVQSTIREQFNDCTVLTIAHRLNTIMDSDRVMVLEEGKIVEFDSPQKLIDNQQTVFHSLAKAAGLV